MNFWQIVAYFFIFLGFGFAMYLWPRICLGNGGYTYQSYENQGRKNYIPYKVMNMINFLVLGSFAFLMASSGSLSFLKTVGIIAILIVMSGLITPIVGIVCFSIGEWVYSIRQNLKKRG